MANSSLYRAVDFIGGRILEARELLIYQNIVSGTDAAGNILVRDLNAIYREGATLNVNPAITSGARTVTLTSLDGVNPMLIFVRGRWEILPSGTPSVTLTSGQTTLYLNWALTIITSVQDTTLVDSSTGQPTANMGELDFSVSATDTSATALTGIQLLKNTVPIPVFTFATAGSSLTLVPTDNVNPEAKGGLNSSGLVRISTSTAAGVACATDDPRLSDSRPPATGSIVNASVRVPVGTGGTNTDGSAQYDLTLDAGGISADKIIWQTYKERVSDYLAGVRSSVASILASLTGHIGASLGLSNTHPLPTATQVGAAPLSHCTLPLGVTGSHPPLVNTNSGGFQVVQTTLSGVTRDPAYGVFQGSTYLAGIEHSGDVFSSVLNAFVASPGGSPLHFTGVLQSLKNVAQVLIDHVNQISHANPHGLALQDIGYPVRVCNSHGCYIKQPDGTIECWGTVSMPASGTPFNMASITFPYPFTTTPVLVVSSVGVASSSGDAGTPPALEIQTLSTTGATVFLARVVVAGAGGGNFDNTMAIQFQARGY